MLGEGSKPIFGNYFGTAKQIFWLSIVTSFLSVVTLGIYRFWAKTRIRRYIWSSIRIGGDAMEYTGSGLEKLLGFLIAVVVLAIYMGVVQLLLMYFGLQLFIEPETVEQALAQIGAIYASLFAVVPLMLYAKFRARRYRMSRTRWRGIRFGMDKAAWGYVWRAMVHWLVTILSLGILTPRMSFYLEKYMTDRTYYGDTVFVQNGKWTDLYKGMKHVAIGVVIMAVSMSVLVITEKGAAMLVFFVGYIWVFVGVVSYQVFSFKYFTANKSLVGEVEFSVEPVTFEIVMRIILVGIGISILAGIVGFIFERTVTSMFEAGSTGIVVSSIAVALGYIVLILSMSAMSLAWIIQPIISQVVKTIQIKNHEDLDQITQRAAADGLDGEGFADALDIGAAI